ncbi:MAG: MFS transporter, partial [Saprospiraceae bacterium]|nr:MFS transporter [Saprospiraceae bacterium]
MKDNRQVENAWAMFDWANSAYNLVISTAIFPPYFIAMTKSHIPVLGNEISNSALYAFAVTFSYAVIAITSPLMSGIADYSGKRMFFLKLFTVAGSISCMLLFFFDGMDTIFLGVSAFVLATIGHAGSLVFYNAYLPEIVSENRMDKVSAKGYAYGYVGSVILLVFNLLVITYPTFFGIPEGSLPVRIAFLTVGIWWLGFAQLTFKKLPVPKALGHSKRILTKGYEELLKVWRELQHTPNTKRFLFSFFFYSAGVQTVIYLASTFAEKELDFGTSELILIILILQLVAIGGAYLFAWLSDITTNKTSLSTMILIWIGICVGAHFVESKLAFYFLSA